MSVIRFLSAQHEVDRLQHLSGGGDDGLVLSQGAFLSLVEVLDLRIVLMVDMG